MNCFVTYESNSRQGWIHRETLVSQTKKIPLKKYHTVKLFGGISSAVGGAVGQLRVQIKRDHVTCR
jgi:hypothetical protein